MMKKKRLLTMMLCACLLLGSIAMPVQAAPKPRFVFVEEESVIKLQNDDGTWACSTWIDEFGHRYHTDENGALQTGWKEIDGQQYFFYCTGAIAVGWTTIGEDVYYFDGNGVMAKDTMINGCLVGSDGKLVKALDEEGNAQQKAVVESILASIITPEMTEEEKLRACYDYMVNAHTYHRTYETPTGDWTGTFTMEIMTTGQGNCYRFAAAYASLLKGLGHDARVATGKIGSSRGGLAPHGWTEVCIGDTWYIFDTEMQYATKGRKNYFFKTYETYPSKPIVREADWPVYLSGGGEREKDGV